MARGYFRTDETICLYCGYTELDGNGSRKPMPYKTGSKNSPTFLCEECGKRAESRGVVLKVNIQKRKGN